MRVQEEQFFLLQGSQIPPKGGGIGNDLPRALFKRHEQAGLVVVARAVYQGLQREHRFAAPRTANDEGAAGARKPPA